VSAYLLISLQLHTHKILNCLILEPVVTVTVHYYSYSKAMTSFLRRKSAIDTGMQVTPAMLAHSSDIEKDYLICEVLGAGTSGQVYRLVKKENSEVYAGKVMDISDEDNRGDVDVEVERLIEFASEATIEVFATYRFEHRAWVSAVHNIN
jgi:serine/threonine protein kinase